MKKRLLIIILFINTLFTFSQKKKNKVGIKKIIETETSVTDTSEKMRQYSIVNVSEKEFDINGLETHRIETQYYMDEPYRTTMTKIIYNNEKRISSEESLIVEDSISYTMHYVYLDDKLIEKKAGYDFNNKRVFHQELLEYDKRGILKRRNYTFTEKEIESGQQSRYINGVFSYNKKGQCIKTDYSKSDRSYTNRITHIRRNNKGHITREKEYYKDYKLIGTTYLKFNFNEKKDWISIQYIKDKKPVKAIYREITYFK